ncbi:hypothetical protein GBAR_LOCUS27665 [Geodia barretti]|uniref:Uncharacterized protein n=1 Tax=Geodia barretti TaxID=519541 RepID=A0AA35TMM4_GEOBA|nr:hypothetical protein GBAR_LOCUS27665 [Geodia barretti]
MRLQFQPLISLYILLWTKVRRKRTELQSPSLRTRRRVLTINEP